MKIISGKFRGRHIKTPAHTSNTRPTKALVRDAVCNSLQHILPGARFLDICAGSGAMGFEAISRGAACCYFIEPDRKTAQIIQQNMQIFCIGEESKLLSCGAISALRKLTQQEQSFDIVYFDPPYGQQLTSDVLKYMDSFPRLISPEGVFVVEEDQKVSVCDMQHFQVVKTKSFGNTQIVMYAHRQLDCHV